MSAPGDLQDTLHEAGRRLTEQRQLLRECGGHLDVGELYRLAHKRDPELSLSTVYRSVRLLRDLGFVDERHLGEEHHHYELNRRLRTIISYAALAAPWWSLPAR